MHLDRPTKAMQILAVLGSAALLALALLDERAAVLGAVSLAPMWLACAGASVVGAAGLGALLGIAYGVAIAPWIPEALQGLGASRVASVAGLLAIVLWAGAPVFAAMALVARVSAHWPLGLAALAWGAAVFGIEWLVSRVWWGVPWGLPGYSQAGVPGVAQLALVGGVPLVSALLAALGVTVARLLLGDPRAPRGLASLAAAWAALALGGLPLAEAVRPGTAPGGGEATLLVVQPHIPRGERWVERLQPLHLHRVKRFVARTLEGDGVGFQALVLPENLLTAPMDETPELARSLEAWVDSLGRPILTGLVWSAPSGQRDRYRSSVAWVEPQQGMTTRVDKQRAIPLIESGRHFPGDTLLRRLLGRGSRAPRVEEAEATSPLEGPLPLAVALCYEMLFPAIVAGRRTDDSLGIVNLADDSWVRGEAAARHLTRIARFRAIEQRLPVVRVAHGGLSAVIDPFGRVAKVLPRHAYASARVELAPAAPPTLGERLAILGLPVVSGLGVWWGAGWLGARRSAASRRGEER